MSGHLIHLVCGSTGAGKTTYAKRLAESLGAIYFSIDEWMATLFWPDAPQPLDPRWALARIDRCNAQIWTMVRQVAGRDVPCVLDLGFAGAAQRASFRRLSIEAGLSAQLHFIDAPPKERWRRVQVRNKEKGDTR
jgi:predicted kinase